MMKYLGNSDLLSHEKDPTSQTFVNIHVVGRLMVSPGYTYSSWKTLYASQTTISIVFTDHLHILVVFCLWKAGLC